MCYRRRNFLSYCRARRWPRYPAVIPRGLLIPGLLSVALIEPARADWMLDYAAGHSRMYTDMQKATGKRGGGVSPYAGSGANQADQIDQIEEIRRLAATGDADAQVNLGGFYRSIRNENEATRWFSLAAQHGHPKAQLFLGFRYAYGIGATKNPEMAVFWLRQAADQGESEAQAELTRRADERISGDAARLIGEIVGKARLVGDKGGAR